MKPKKIKKNKRIYNRVIKLFKEANQDGAYRVSRRLHAIVLNMEGYTAPEIANILKVHRTNVSIWLRNWDQEGFDAILEGYRPGRPKALSEQQTKELEDILESGPVAYGFNSGVWTCPMVARVIEDEFSVYYHPAHVSKILHKLEFSVQRPRKVLAKADKEKQSRWIRHTYKNIKKKLKKKKPS